MGEVLDQGRRGLPHRRRLLTSARGRGRREESSQDPVWQNEPLPTEKDHDLQQTQADFTFYVNYADMDYLGKAEVENVGSMNLTSVLVKGVKEALDKNLVGDNIETKGVKAHSS